MGTDGTLLGLVGGSTSCLDSGTRLRVTMGSSLLGGSLLSMASLRAEFSAVGMTVVGRAREILVGNGAFPSWERSTKLVGLAFLPSGNSRDSVIPEEPTGVLLEVDFCSKFAGPFVMGAGGLASVLVLGKTCVETVGRVVLLLAPG